jgi:hypothetical protein
MQDAPCHPLLVLHDAASTPNLCAPVCTLGVPLPPQLHEFLTNVQHSFEYFDQDRSNSLSYDEIFNALTHAGGWL